MSAVRQTFLSQSDEATRLRAAFPASTSAEVDSVLAIVKTADIKTPDTDIGPVAIRGEALHIPYRIYFEEPTSISTISKEARIILACLFSRHHNGFVRQKFSTELVEAQQEWVPPFVIQLLGEYLPQIEGIILGNIDKLGTRAYTEFIKENPKFIELTKSRMISYWQVYYRWEYPRFADFPAFKVFDAFGVWKNSRVRNLVAR